MEEAERRCVARGERPVDFGRRLVRREQRARPFHAQWAAAEAQVVIGHGLHVEVQVADLPDPAFLDVGVFILPHAPNAVGPRLREHDHALPACQGRTPVGRHCDDRLQLHVVVEPALSEPFRPEQQQRPADAVLADIDAALAVFEGAIGRKEIGRLAPQALVEVVAPGCLQLLDRDLILQPLNPLAIGGEPFLRGSLGTGRRGGRQADRRRASERHERPAAGHWPALTCLPVTGFGAWNGGTCTAGNAS